jgi:hypothetical protein
LGFGGSGAFGLGCYGSLIGEAAVAGLALAAGFEGFFKNTSSSSSESPNKGFFFTGFPAAGSFGASTVATTGFTTFAG